jgi:hypothetical protein
MGWIIYIALVIISYYWSRHYIKTRYKEYWTYDTILLALILSCIAPIVSSIVAWFLFVANDKRPPNWL